MSNYLAIATLTAAFGAVISRAMHEIPGLSAAPELRYGRPPADPTFVGANLLLYRTAPSAIRRNEDLATRNAGGQLLRRPTAAVELEYLVSFYGNDATLESQRLMGNVITSLHASPVLDRQMIRRSIEAAGPESFLAVSDLDQQAEPLHFSPVPLEPDVLHRIWALFVGSPFAPSLMYSCTTLMLSPDVSILRALPTRAPQLGATPSMAPVIEALEPTRVSAGTGAVIRVSARNAGGDCYALIADTVTEATNEGKQLRVGIPPDLPAGPLSLRLGLGAPEDGLLSQSTIFMLLPRVGDRAWIAAAREGAGPAQGAVVACALTPLPLYDQPASLILTPTPAARASGATAVGSTAVLRLEVDAQFAGELDRSLLPPSLTQILKTRGVVLDAAAQVSVLQPGLRWRVEDGATKQACMLQRNGPGIQVNFGLPAARPDLNQAFLLSAMPAPGQYLVAVQIGDNPACTSQLRAGTRIFGPLAVPSASLDDGVVPDAVQAAFAAAGIRLPEGLSVVRPQPAAGWELRGAAGGSAFWIMADEAGLIGYQLDTTGGQYFAPLLAVGKAG